MAAKSNKKKLLVTEPTPVVQVSNLENTVNTKSIVKTIDDNLYYKVFWGLALLLLIAVPILSTQYGITADEWGNKKYGELCLDFFKTMGQNKAAVSYAPVNGEVMYCYGPTIDVLSAIVYQTFNLDPYTVRHIFFALTGTLLMVFCGLLGRLIGGNWRVGLISLVFMALSPRIFGDSMNNPKDISFAAGYILSIYGLIKFIQELPKPSWRSVVLVVLGTGLALGGRVPGLILIAYIPLFVGIEVVFRKGLWRTVFGQKTILKDILLKTMTMACAGYLAGIALWPFALTKPFTNTLVALKTLTNFPVSIKTIFDGNKIESILLPWYYVPKLMAITTPLYFLCGLLVFVCIFFFSGKSFNKHHLLLLLFVALFPLYYSINKHSAFYNGWRHTTFLYAPLIVISALGFEFLFQKTTKIGQTIVALVLAVLCSLPLVFIAKNHPYQYCYYNELIGGMKGAYGNYESDYFGASTRQLTDWIKTNVDLKTKKIIIATDFLNPVDQYFTDYPNVSVQYHRFYQRSEKDWDYGIFLTSRLTPSHFKNLQYFPPTGTVHKVAIDDMPIGLVIKRPTKDDLTGVMLMKAGKTAESIPVLEKALKADPNNEVILVYLANAHNNTGNFDKALAVAQSALVVVPEYTSAKIVMGVSYINLRKYDSALLMLGEALDEDPTNKEIPKYVTICNEQKNKNNKGAKEVDGKRLFQAAPLSFEQNDKNK